MTITVEHLERLKTAVREHGQQLQEQQRIWDKSNPQTREIWRLDRARTLYDLAVKELTAAETTVARVRAWEAEVERIRQLRAPPDLQALVLVHGTYNQITPDAWAQWDRDMAEWKAKMRNGEFPTPPMAPFP